MLKPIEYKVESYITRKSEAIYIVNIQYDIDDKNPSKKRLKRWFKFHLRLTWSTKTRYKVQEIINGTYAMNTHPSESKFVPYKSPINISMCVGVDVIVRIKINI
jgi:hypothetical protein